MQKPNELNNEPHQDGEGLGDYSQDQQLQQNPDQMNLPGKAMKAKNPRFGSNKRLPNLKKFVVILLIILLIAGLGYAAWKYLINSDSEEVAVPAQTEQTQMQPETTEPQTSPLSEEYSSSDLRIDFKYPADWKVSEGAGGIKITSPEFTYMTNGGDETNGFFKIYMRKGARDVDSKYIGQAVAIKPSEDLSYSDPAPGQRKDTYLTSFGLDTTDSFNFFLVAGNFKLKKGDSLGPDYGTEASAYIIVGGYSSEDLSEDLQMNSVPIDMYDQNSAYKQAVEIIKTVQLK